jgi:CRISPR-associated protein Cst2
MNGFYSLSLSARATLDLHSLNNEGGEGNQIQTRMVNIVGEDGRMYNVNAISGDMWKHIQAEHLFRLAAEGDRVPLCEGCRRFDANRISADTAFQAQLQNKETKDADVLDSLLQTCALDDMEGNLLTMGNRSLPRKSVVEFGWVVGVPDSVATDSYFHVKYASERSAGQRAADETEEARGANLGQNIFHRPASSGVYAIVANLELARIGLNDITQVYAISQEERVARQKILLESLLYSFLQPNGAMRNTQNPHLVAFAGVVAVSQCAVPAPTVSPLTVGYDVQIKEITQSLEPLHGGQIQLYPFGSLAEFAQVMAGLIESGEPYQLTFRG